MKKVICLILGVALFFGMMQYAGNPKRVLIIKPPCKTFECLHKRTI